MRYNFSSLVIAVISSLMLAIYLLWLSGVSKIEYEVYAKFSILSLFMISSICVVIRAIIKYNLETVNFKKDKLLIIIPLIILLVTSIFHKKIGINATGLFVVCSLIYFIKNKTLFSLSKIYYFLFAYVLLLIVGTIGSPQGFHFPERAYTFLLLPISFSFFDLSRNDLLRIARVFFRIMLIFLSACLVYWWFNFLNLDTTFSEWVTGKIGFEVDMRNWEAQYEIQKSIYYPAYYFVNSWAYYFHPSYISLVLFFAMIIGLFLYTQNDVHTKISTFDILFFMLMCLLIIVLMESRVGFVIFLLLSFAIVLYYFKHHTRYFNIALIVSVLASVLFFFLFSDKIEGFLMDETRSSLTTIAIAQIKEHFWWGAGTQNQRLAIDNQLILMGEEMPDNLTYIHNQFLGNMVQFGISGLIVLLILLFGILRYAFKNKSFILHLFLLILFIFMLIEEPLYTQEGITRCTIFLVFFVALIDSNKERKQVKISNFFKNR